MVQWTRAHIFMHVICRFTHRGTASGWARDRRIKENGVLRWAGLNATSGRRHLPQCLPHPRREWISVNKRRGGKKCRRQRSKTGPASRLARSGELRTNAWWAPLTPGELQALLRVALNRCRVYLTGRGRSLYRE